MTARLDARVPCMSAIPANKHLFKSQRVCMYLVVSACNGSAVAVGEHTLCLRMAGGVG
jgi:hypothetical protein